jgi:hypothetical protein
MAVANKLIEGLQPLSTSCAKYLWQESQLGLKHKLQLLVGKGTQGYERRKIRSSFAA